ncbi:MAG: hybrid sensor histidine kinase/response regulator [Desulfobacteraceae bacterium]|nr:hybrid sensor histidine kinase/response regulator [Desulfobacteraceae bacterium]
MFEDDETLRMYVDESLDHLGDIESDLLSIEQSGADIDVDLVNNVFRAAHSIKGGAGFMGLVTIKELSHSLENVLGLIREKELVPDSEKISVLLNGFDKLETMLNAIEKSNEEDVSKHIELLSKITQASLDDEKLEAVSEVVDIEFANDGLFIDISLYEIEQHMNEGKNVFIVEYDLINDIQLKNKNPLHVMQNIAKTGIIIDSKIDFASIGTLDDDTFSSRIPFQILFSSIIEYDMASTLFEVDEAFIHLVTDDMLVSSDKSETSEPKEEIIVKEEKPAVTEEKPPKAKKQVTEEVKEEVKIIAEKKPVKKAPKIKAAEPASGENTAAILSTKPQTSLRVNVNLLDTLMNLAGELVLSRNQLLQGVNSSNEKATEQSSQRIDMITSELQEAIMKTRMQPIGNIFTKFTRIVRDMSRDLEKSIDLEITGQEVELDKTILESINDPLTHLIRNSVDHGIESPVDRERIGKDATGKIKLRAFHEAGQVNIEISDDGKGLDPETISTIAFSKGLVTEGQIAEMSDKEQIELIFMAGFSTAEEITDVSGRGVGMDVVITNIETLGGIIELDSTPGKGTTTQIKLPLTLAIIPSQIAAVGDEKYAIPQVNLDELLRIPAGDIKTRVEKVGDASVVRLRGELLPLLNLTEVLGIDKTFINPEDDTLSPDRRKNIADRRSKQLEEAEEEAMEDVLEETETPQRNEEDRRYHASSALNIAVVSAGAFKYGLVVDELLDSEEIVVKPVGRHLKKCEAYAGATIMGDGRVALILDISSLAQIANLTAITKKKVMKKEAIDETSNDERVALLTFRNDESEHFAAPLNLVERIERIELSSIEEVGHRKVVQYRGGALPLFEISQAAEVKPLPIREQQEVIVFKVKDRELGLMVTPPVDAMEIALEIDESTLRQSCITGSMIINEKTTLLIDIFEFMKEMNPEWFQKDIETKEQLIEEGVEKTILFAEDSAFFRNQVKSFMSDEGFVVLEAEDGQIAWELLKERSESIDIVVTDLEMPNMDGFELTKKIKETPEYSHFKVIALTSLASESHIQKGRKVGIDEYEIKLDREKLMKIIKQYLNIQ